MKKYGFTIVAVAAMGLAIFMAGCGKKEVPVQEEAAMSMDALTASVPEPVTESTAPQGTSVEAPVVSGQLEPLPPAGPYKPTVGEIQTALKNAGYYSGSIDGKAGPKTKKAIESFQSANSLKADGKVGSMTWGLLSKYLRQQ